MDVEVATPELDTPTTPEPEPTIAEHEAQFGPPDKRQQPEPDEPNERPRHRASSQKATPDDVAQIAALTKELREQEAQLVKLRPDALAGSPRLTVLKRQIAAIKSELADAQPKPAPPVPNPLPAVTTVSAPSASSPGTFTEKEPTLDQFEKETDPYAAYLRALGRYDRRRDEFEQKQAEHASRAKEQQTAAERADQDRYNTIRASYQTKVEAFKREQPDFDAVLSAIANDPVPPLAQATLMQHDNGPKLVYTLAQQPELLADLYLKAAPFGVKFTDTDVAIMQRWLTSRVQAVTTGSVATPPRTLAPRPPNPVRTGPIRAGDALPGDDSSLAEHEQAFGPRRRR